MKRKIIAIVGPTASGKTGIGVRLAKELDGEIISADSRQLYRGLDIGSGKEGTPAQSAGIPNSKFLISNSSTALTTGQIQNPNDQMTQNKKSGVILSECEESFDKLRTSSSEAIHAPRQLSGLDPSAKPQDDNEGDKQLALQQGSGQAISNLRNALRCVNGVPQWMIDVAEPGDHINLFDYLAMARLVIEDIFSRGKLPIIVGGTGLYVQGLVEGFSLEQISNSKFLISNQTPNPKSKSKIDRTKLENMTIDELKETLLKLDQEEYKKIDLKNPHRIIRSIERAQEGLKPVKIKPDFEVLQIAIDLPRKELFDRIDKRVEERFEAGMLEEVQKLLGQGISTNWLLSLGLEYRIITEFFLKMAQLFHCSIANLPPKNNTAIEQYNNEFNWMKQDLKFKIHQFARRQITWFRRFPEVNWLKDYDQIKRFVKIFLEH